MSASTPQVICWDFTRQVEDGLSDPETRDLGDLISRDLDAVCNRYTFQLEEGEATGKRHFQGRMHLIKKNRVTGLVKLFRGTAMGGCHLSVTSSANHKNMFYVMKEETKVKGFEIWTDSKTAGEEAEKNFIPRQLMDFHVSTMRPWQRRVVEMSKGFDTRKINVIIDTLGNNGKSLLVLWMLVNKMGLEVPPSNDFKDMTQYLCSTVSQKGRESARNIFIDLPRSIKKEKTYAFMAGIERIKDGRIFDMRYKATEIFIDSPNIFVFTNVIPELEYLSLDRWDFYTIGLGYSLKAVTFVPGETTKDAIEVDVRSKQDELKRELEIAKVKRFIEARNESMGFVVDEDD